VGCDVLYHRSSPDGKLVAFVGSYRPLEGDEQHGLFVAELKTGQVRQLVDKALKTTPAWSPDSKRLAIGNSPGYGNVYPLAIIDVSSGQIEDIGVQGVGAAWSPDGRWIAVTTQLGRGGSWSAGIPTDGRIGLWDTQDKKLSYVSPPGYNIYDQQTGHWATSGALRPVWSPDSQWIAYEQSTTLQRGKLRSSDREIWVTGRDGTGLRRVLAYSTPVTWSEDSRYLIVDGSDPRQQFEVAKLPVIPEDDWPRPPSDLMTGKQKAAEAEARVGDFDPTPIFERNRAWQNPSLDHLKSVQFTHVMRPIRLDERFVWRGDGSSFLEVVHREDEHAEKEIGRLWVTMPEGAQYYFAADAQYPRREEKTQQEVAEYVRDHLMGTRVSFTALDWGRDPGGFSVQDVRRDPEKRTLVIKLVPSRGRDRYYVHGGAMFETTSWAYVHHLYLSWSEITVDAENHRIMHEVDYGSDGQKICEVDLDDWIEPSERSSAPRRVQLRFPGSKFHVDYRFEWLPEGLWILRKGESHFDGKDPQREEIVDLKLNDTVPELEERLARARHGREAMEGKSQLATGTHVLKMHPFELGESVQLAPEGREGRTMAVEDLLFTLALKGPRFREMGSHPSLWADIGLVGDPEASPADQLVLVLYDGGGLPLSTAQVPLAAIALADRPVADLLEEIHRKNAIWLAPNLEHLPDASYTFYSRSSSEQCSIHDPKNPHCRRGVTMTLPLDAFLASPDSYHGPVIFEGKLDGREVTTAIICGPQFGWVFGNGISHSWQGYIVSVDTQCLLVTDKETGCPLVSRFGPAEVRFLDYVEVEPGQYAPLRIVVDRGTWSFDFRFQIVDGELWLLDHAVDRKGEKVIWVDGISTGGAEPAQIQKASDGALEVEIERFDWTSITDRNILRDAENPLVQQIVAHDAPFEHGQYKLFGQILSGDAPRIAVDLGRSRVLTQARYWTLSHVGSRDGGRDLLGNLIPGPADFSVQTFPVRLNEPQVIHLRASHVGYLGQEDQTDQSGTRLRSIEFHTNDCGELIAKLEAISQDHRKGLSAVASGVLLDENESPLAAAHTSWAMWIRKAVHSQSDISMNFGVLPKGRTPVSVVLALKTVQIGQHMGSAFATFFDYSPLFPYEQMLAAGHSRVWKTGLNELNAHLRREVMREELFDDDVFRGDAPRQTRAKTLMPHRDQLAALLERAEDPDGLAWLCRLAGHSGDDQFVSLMLPLLKDPSDDVKDAAAIGLGLLGKADGTERLEAIIGTAMPKDDSARHVTEQLKTDAALALGAIGTKASLHALGQAMVDSARQGQASVARNYAYALGHARTPLALDYFTQLLAAGEEGKSLAREVLFIVKAIDDQAAVQQFFRNGIRRGDGMFLRYAPVDPALVAEVGEMVLREDLEPWAFYRSVRYLQNDRDPKVLRYLREAFDRRLHADYDEGRRQLAMALAAYRDYRGLGEVFHQLAGIERLGPLPDDPDERRREERRRGREKEDIIEDVLLECFPKDELVRLLSENLGSKDKRAVAAALDVIETEPFLGESLKPQIERLKTHADASLADRAKRLAARWTSK
jgi:hypothetical protein